MGSQGFPRRGASPKVGGGALTIASGTLALSATTVNLSSVTLTSTPQAGVVTVTNSGSGQLAGPTSTISYVSGSGWLSQSWVANENIYTLTLTAVATSLAVGSYQATVTVADARATNSGQTITVNLTVTAAPATELISLSANARYFSATAGGATPAAQTVEVLAENGGSLGTVTATGTQSWLTVSYVAPTITITPNTTALSAGNYTDTITVTASNASNSPRTISITYSVSVAAPVSIALSTGTATFSAVEGAGNPNDQTINITNGGSGTLSGLAVSKVGGAAWLNVSLDTTTAPAVLTLDPVTGALSAGTYTETVNVTSGVANNSPQTVSVQFTVTASGSPTNYTALRYTPPENYEFSTATGDWSQTTPGWYYGTLPPNRGSVADAVVTSQAQMTTALANAAAGTGDYTIQIDAAITAPTGGWQITQGSRTGHLVIRGGAGGAIRTIPTFAQMVADTAGTTYRGTYVTPSDFTAGTYKITGGSDNRIFFFGDNVQKVWIENLELASATGGNSTWLVHAGRAVTAVANIPSRFGLAFCYIHGDPAHVMQRGVIVDTDRALIYGNYFSEFKWSTSEPQALACLGVCNGRHEILNNHFSASGENVFYGGGDQQIAGTVTNPFHIVFGFNHLYKPASWKGVYQVKNIFELKTGQQVAIVGNILDGSWTDAQAGSAFNLKASNQTNATVLQGVKTANVTVMYNIIRNAGRPWNLLAHENTITTSMNRVELRDNLAYDINSATYNGTGEVMAMAGDAGGALQDITVDHNTIVLSRNDGTGLTTTYSGGSTGSYDTINLAFTNNIIPRTGFGPKKSGFAEGTASINARHSGSLDWSKNMVVGISGTGNYPATTIASSATDYSGVGFASVAADNYQLSSGSGLGAGTDGKDLGADITKVLNYTRGVD